MVIQCPECQARFKMADEKARPGVKVRCSRCQQVFPVQVTSESTGAPGVPAAAPKSPPAMTDIAPEASTAAAISSSVFDEESAFDQDQAGTFPGTEETKEPAFSIPKIEGFDLADFSLDTETTTDSAFASDRSDELDLGDFNTDEPQPATQPAPETNNFTFDDDSSATTEFSFDEVKTTDADFDFSDPAAEKDFSFEAEISSDDPFNEEPVGDATKTDGEESFSFQPDGNEFSFDDLSPSSALSIDAPPLAKKPDAASATEGSTWSSGGGPHDDFDFTPADPTSGAEEFDFSTLSFGEESPSASSTPPLSPAVSAILPPLDATYSASPKEEYGEPSFPEDELLMPAPERRKSPILGLLIVLLLLLGGVAGYFFWQGGIPEFSSLRALLTGKTPPPAIVGQIRVTDLNSYFVDNTEAGQLFVVQGRVVNEYAETRSAIAVKGVLFNQSGQALVQQTVFPGNMLNESNLRTLPFAKIEESMNNQFGDSLSNLNIAPGKSLPFTIVFRNLPAGLAEFTAEVSDSKPGSD